MFAVLKTGGKQYKVAAGDTLRVEKLAASPGDAIQFNEVLMVGDQVGTPLVAGAAVQATVIDQVKGEKLIHFVRRRRKHSSKRTKGHRQQLTLVRVTDILAAGGEATGVMAAIGAGYRDPAAHEAPKARAPRAEAQAPAEQAPAPAAGGLVGTARRAAASARDGAEAALDRVEAAAGTAVDAVADAASDVVESKAGKVALAAAAAAGVAAIAAAVLLPGGARAEGATGDDASDDDAAPDADSKE